MKIVYIAHAISGPNQADNLKRVREICGRIFRQEPDVVPIAPYLLAFEVLDDNNRDERKIGMDANFAILEKIRPDEVRVYGSKLSAGVVAEISWAAHNRVPVRFMKPSAASELLMHLASPTSE